MASQTDRLRERTSRREMADVKNMREIVVIPRTGVLYHVEVHRANGLTAPWTDTFSDSLCGRRFFETYERAEVRQPWLLRRLCCYCRNKLLRGE